jgi:hypothetical protein
LAGDRIALDEYSKMDELIAVVTDWTKTNDGWSKVQRTAEVLLAGLFFFEPDEGGIIRATDTTGRCAAGRNQLSGSIRCRLPRNSNGLRKLLTEKGDSLWSTVLDHGMMLNDSNSSSNIFWEPITVSGTSEKLSSCVNDEIGQCHVRINCTFGDDAGGYRFHVIALKLKGSDRRIPISGFPATMAVLMERASTRWLQ